MPSMDLNGNWQEAKAGLSMADGEKYVIEFHGPVSTTIRALDVQGATMPSTAEDEKAALVHFNRDLNPRAEEPLEFEARAGWTWWLKTDGGASRLVAAEV